MPNMGEEIEEGLGSMLSTAIVSVTETEKEGINEGSVFGDIKNDQKNIIQCQIKLKSLKYVKHYILTLYH